MVDGVGHGRLNTGQPDFANPAALAHAAALTVAFCGLLRASANCCGLTCRCCSSCYL